MCSNAITTARLKKEKEKKEERKKGKEEEGNPLHFGSEARISRNRRSHLQRNADVRTRVTTVIAAGDTK